MSRWSVLLAVGTLAGSLFILLGLPALLRLAL